tara:strand:+ start:4154 stop:4411 length:258 start_codon:yes stop_codon:yes gene_type:complete
MEDIVIDLKKRIGMAQLQLRSTLYNAVSDPQIEQKRITSEQMQKSIQNVLEDDAYPNQYANDTRSLVNTLRQRIAEARSKLQSIE